MCAPRDRTTLTAECLGGFNVKEHFGANATALGIAMLNQIDHTHLSRKGHAQLAQALAEQIPKLI